MLKFTHDSRLVKTRIRQHCKIKGNLRRVWSFNFDYVLGLQPFVTWVQSDLKLWYSHILTICAISKSHVDHLAAVAACVRSKCISSLEVHAAAFFTPWNRSWGLSPQKLGCVFLIPSATCQLSRARCTNGVTWSMFDIFMQWLVKKIIPNITKLSPKLNKKLQAWYRNWFIFDRKCYPIKCWYLFIRPVHWLNLNCLKCYWN
jgi:hypothetical protein